MEEGSPEAQLSRARVAPVRMKLGLTTVSKRFSPRCGNVCTATLMCAHSPTPQGDGDEMAAARTSLWTPPRQNVQAKRPAESLGRWLRHQAARWGCSWRLQPFGCVLSKDFLRVSSRYRSARIPIRGAFSSFSWRILGQVSSVRYPKISFFFYCAPNCKVPKSSVFC